MIAQRRLGVAVHQCRLLVPPEVGPAPIESEWSFTFDLASPDNVDLRLVPDFPCSREQAVERARRQRLDVRLMVNKEHGSRTLQNKEGQTPPVWEWAQLPFGLAFKNTTPSNGGVALKNDLPGPSTTYLSPTSACGLESVRPSWT